MPDVAADPLTGQTLGEYTLAARLGQGASGSVYRARQVGLERDVVVKVLGGGDPQAFLREARLAAKLDHPYAAHVYGFGVTEEGLRWIAFELVEGTTLGAWLAAQGPLPLDRAIPFVEKLAEVVQTAHERKIIHRDLSPSNVMVLARAGRLLPKLLDLGLAGAEGATGGGGTPAIMAPEQWHDDRPVTAAADVYALALLTWSLLAGGTAFPDRDLDALREAHASRPLPPLPPHVPAAVHEVLAAGAAKVPASRPSAIELAARLRVAAGLAGETPLPALDEGLRRRAIAELPQPLAEAIALLEEARHVPEALAAIRRIASTAAQLLGVLALASASRAPPAPEGEAARSVRSLAQRDPSPRDWLSLSAALTTSFAGLPDTHALPELVLTFAAGPPAAALALDDELALAQRQGLRDDDDGRRGLRELLAKLQAWLEKLFFLAEVPLCVARPSVGRAERWVGLRRQPRRRALLAGSDLADGEPLLVDAEGHPLLRLAPLAVVAAPSPGAAEELFLFAGPGRHGARFEAPPRGYVRHEEGVWEWLAANVAPVGARADVAEDDRSPYPGLAAFGVADASLFVGRERDSEEALNRLRATPLLAVVGRSGAGKSSFVHAGLLAAMAAEGGWHWRSFRPGSAPSAALERAIEALGAEPGVTPVIVVDQLEELFTLCDAPAERLAFATRLVGLCDQGLRVVVTLRDDFLARLEALAPFRRRLAQTLVLVDTPAPAELRRILAEPPRRLGYEWEDAEMLDEMVAAVADEPGALALVSFAGAALWAKRDRHFRLLRRRPYESLGGITGALVRHAEATFGELVDAEQRALRGLFRRLITPEGTRAPVSRRELAGLGADRIIERLVAARLLVVSESGDQIEVVHEALLSRWPRVATWLEEDAEETRRRDALRHAARLWDTGGRSRGLLWRDDALLELELWRRRSAPEWTALEQEFVSASTAEAGRGRRLRVGLTLLAIAGLVIGVAALWRANLETEQAQGRAEASAAESERLLVEQYVESGQRLLNEGDPPRALPYLVEAYRRGARDPGLTTALGLAMAKSGREEAVLSGHEAGVAWVAVSPDDGTIASASLDGTIRLWTTDGRPKAELRHRTDLRRVVFSPDGKRLASAAGSDVQLWDVASGRSLAHWVLADTAALRLAFSPDGRKLAASGSSGGLAIITVDGSEAPRQLPAHTARVNVLLGREDSVVLGSADRTISVWSWDGVERHRLVGHEDFVMALAAGKGRAPLVSGGLDGTVRVWDETQERAVLVLSGHVGGAHDVAIDPKGELVAAAAGDGGVRLWRLPSGSAAGTLAGHRGLVVRAVFSPGGQQLLSVGQDGLALLWDPTDTVLVSRLVGHEDFLVHGVYVRDGSRVITTSLDRTIRIWRTTPTEIGEAHVSPPIGEPLAPGAITLRARVGTRTIAATTDGHVRIWEGPRVVADLPLKPGPVRALAACPDRFLVATDRSAQLFDGTGASVGALVGHNANVVSLALSSDCALAATLASDGTQVIWDAIRRRPLRSGRGPVASLAFLAGDRKLALEEGDGRTRIIELPREERTSDAALREAACRSPHRLVDGQPATAARACK